MLTGALVAAASLAGALYGYVHLPKFGALPAKSRQEAIDASPYYRDGQFRNVQEIPVSIKKGGSAVTLFRYLTTKKDAPFPPAPIPAVKTDLAVLNPREDVLIWLGHSSLYLQVAGRRILVDPVFCENAAPVPGSNMAFASTHRFTANEIPLVDVLLITHDHWDHLDYGTIKALKNRVGICICPLGVGAHLERWQVPVSKIAEADWNTKIPLADGLDIHLLPSRHFSGRFIAKNKTQWAAFAIITEKYKIFISGDGGYGRHFKEIGKTFQGFDLAILECGQYSHDWPHNHMKPEETAQAALDLGARAVLPYHNSKYSIAYHSWDDPLNCIAVASRGKDYRLLTPIPGEPVALDGSVQEFSRWWEHIGA